MNHRRRFGAARAPLAIATLNAFLSGLVPAGLARAHAAEDERPAAPATEPERSSAAVASAPSKIEGTGGGTPSVEMKAPAGGSPATSEERAATQPSFEALALGSSGGGVGANALALPSGAATIGGLGDSFSPMLSTGAAGFSVPIPLLPARGQAQPSLTLTYSSDAGNGVAGVGWSIGVPFIARDTSQGPPAYRGVGAVGSDRFVYNGAEIVPVCVVSASLGCTGARTGESMPAWSAGWTYFRSRVETGFQRIFWSADGKTWRLQDKSGLQAELGVPLDASGDTSAVEASPTDASKIFRWNVSRQYDVNGTGNPLGDAKPQPSNIVAYRYLHDGNLAYPSDIYDTPPVTSPGTAALTSYAHHTHLVWQARSDVMTTYRRGWSATQGLRLATVDVTSMPFVASASKRNLVRRVHLTYDATYHVSLLTSIREEGRCAGSESTGAIAEQSDGTLPATSCGMLPALTLGYTHATQAGPTAAGFEKFDTTLHSLASSPALSPGDGYTSFFDANADGLPDLLHTNTSNAISPGNHLLYLNGAVGTADHFGAVVPTTLAASTSGVNIGALNFANTNVVPADINGDGRVDLSYVPASSGPQTFTAQVSGNTASWLRQAPVTNPALFAQLNLAINRPRVNALDVNGDGAVDMVLTSDTGIQTYLSLSPWVGGYGAFGSPSVSSTGVTLSSTPISTCIPTGPTPVTFNDPTVQVADMNGDGLLDLVRVLGSQVFYWPGHGDGRWGVGDMASCAFGQQVSNVHVAMTGSPLLSTVTGIGLADVNGDGLADLLQLGATNVAIWLNINGASFAPVSNIAAPVLEANLGHIQLVDVNGSGTSDVVWADAGNYRYIDLMGGARPWLLSSIANGYGKTTSVAYGTSTVEMQTAASAGSPWTTTIPMVVPVVKSVTTRDNLNVAGRSGGVYVKTYSYRDPDYDLRRREFRGFRDAITTVVGDANEPTTVVETKFLAGDCVDEDAKGRCDTNARALDNLRDALKGVPWFEETRDAHGVALSTSITTYRLRQLYTSLDGRAVRQVFPSRVDTYHYDTGSFAPSAQSVSVANVEVERTLGTVANDPSVAVTLPSTAGRARTSSSSQVDDFGNPIATVQSGCVEGCSPVDEVITNSAVTHLVSNGSGWTYRPTESWVTGTSAPSVQRNHTYIAYDASARPTAVTAQLVGTVPLLRSNSAPGGQVAPAPAHASVDGVVPVKTMTYDAFGNVTATTSASQSCASATFDPTYAELPVVATFFVGAAGSNGCGTTQLVTTAQYDRGLRAITNRTGVNGEVGKADYDEHGRVIDEYVPDPDNVGHLSASPSATYQYFVTADATSQPWSTTVSYRQSGATAGATTTHASWSFVDGIGRTIARLEQADPSAGDGGAWLVSHFVDFDGKGNVFHQYQPWYWNGANPQTFSIGAASTPSSYAVRDSFGRATDTYTFGGTHVEHQVFHALSRDVWDAGHLASASYSTFTQDGHNRVVATLQRFSSGTAADSRKVTIAYLPTGEPTVFTRSHGTGSDAPIVRWLRYDSLGRVVLNVEPDTTVGFTADSSGAATALQTIRYAYDVAGRLLGTSDARGCGENFTYDAAGRVLSEDFSPCNATQPTYSAPAANGDGTEVFYAYDGADPENAAIVAAGCATSNALRGKLVSVSSRGAKDVASYDARGRLICAARKVARPGAPIAALASRYAPRWYASTTGYDGADRVVRQTTGARSPELLVGGSSAVTTVYAASGAPLSVGSSYGTLVQSFVHDAMGAPTAVTYGDVAATKTSFAYDARHRVSSVLTSRAAPSLWSKAANGYVPPSTPATTQQLVLESGQISYDAASNPIEIQDLRNGTEWPAGAKPVSRAIAYDDLYRVTDVKYAYTGGNDAWTSPYLAEDTGSASVSTLATPSPHVSFTGRTLEESFAFDWKGNSLTSDDDEHGFYDRSLGAITNGSSNAGPYQLLAASNRGRSGVTTRAGDLAAQYDAAGQLVALVVHRDGPCMPQTFSCWQRFAYAWDEIGQLIDARRWDLVGTERSNADVLAQAPPSRAANVELSYEYAQGHRVLKTATGSNGVSVQTVYVFSSLELHRTTFDTTAGDYVLNASVEVPYLKTLEATARIVYAPTSVPTATSGRLHTFLELPDHLGSSAIIIDRDTSELVERTTYSAFGSTESDYRPDRWGDFREERKFTGKEDDIEVGLQYFGARYYSAPLGRWASPDPLALHSPGAEDDNLYAYGHGRAYAGKDPDGRFFIIDDAIWVGIGIGILIGLAVNAAVQAYNISNKRQEKWDWSSFWVSGIAGGVGGGFSAAATLYLGGAALMEGAGVVGKAGVRLASSLIGSAGGGMTARALTPGQSARDGAGLLTDLVIGALSWGVMEGVTPLLKGASQGAKQALQGAPDATPGAGAPAPGGGGPSGEPIVPTSGTPAPDVAPAAKPQVTWGAGNQVVGEQVENAAEQATGMTNLNQGTKMFPKLDLVRGNLANPEEVAQVKSLDLTAPSYAKNPGSALSRLINREVDKLSLLTPGTEINGPGGTFVNIGPQTTKTLIVGVPTSGWSDSLEGIFKKLQQDAAQQQGIQVLKLHL